VERVKIIQGRTPIIIVAPHGADDERTALVAEKAAKETKSYAVINMGWQKGEKVDFMNDYADCNNVLHCHEDVVREEFFDPIIRFKNKILSGGTNEVNIFYIHGMSNRHRILANDPMMDMVLGYGVGIPHSITFDLWKKNFFIDRLENLGFTTYEASQGSSMAGWSKNNMNQLFRKWYLDVRVSSIQIEIVHEMRESDRIAERTGGYLGEAIIETLVAKHFTLLGSNKVY
jgi:hypothetical protein